MRRQLSALMLVTAVLTAATGTLARPAQAAGASDPGSFGIRLVDVPTAEASNPRALQYIIDHVHPGTTIRRRVLVANLSPHPGHLTIYPDAATITAGSFLGLAGQTRSDLTTWITTSRHLVSLAPHASTMVLVTIHVPPDAASGNRYGVIWAQETSRVPHGTGVEITEINRVGVRIYLSVGRGGAPPSSFAITSLTATRSAHGQPLVRADVRNTGGLALDISGNLRLSQGPGGVTAGPYKDDTDVTLAPGQSGPVTIVLSNKLPDGPWRALLSLASGLTRQQTTATIRFPGSATKTKTAALPGYLILAAVLLFILILALIAAWLTRRNRRSPTLNRGPRRPTAAR